MVSVVVASKLDAVAVSKGEALVAPLAKLVAESLFASEPKDWKEPEEAKEEKDGIEPKERAPVREAKSEGKEKASVSSKYSNMVGNLQWCLICLNIDLLVLLFRN